jgi:hypothetical protein
MQCDIFLTRGQAPERGSRNRIVLATIIIFFASLCLVTLSATHKYAARLFAHLPSFTKTQESVNIDLGTVSISGIRLVHRPDSWIVTVYGKRSQTRAYNIIDAEESDFEIQLEKWTGTSHLPGATVPFVKCAAMFSDAPATLTYTPVGFPWKFAVIVLPERTVSPQSKTFLVDYRYAMLSVVLVWLVLTTVFMMFRVVVSALIGRFRRSHGKCIRCAYTLNNMLICPECGNGLPRRKPHPHHQIARIETHANAL